MNFVPPSRVVDVTTVPHGGVPCARCGVYLTRVGVRVEPIAGGPSFWLGPDCAGSIGVRGMTPAQKKRLAGENWKAYVKGLRKHWKVVLDEIVLPRLDADQSDVVLRASEDKGPWNGVLTAVWGSLRGGPFLPELQSQFPRRLLLELP